MSKHPSNWHQITNSEFTWESEALEFVRQNFPEHEPYRAWANFEFIADNGSISEVDLFVVSPKGAFLVEIKSHPGTIAGDAGSWLWTREVEGKEKSSAMDNPLLVTDRKAKKLKSLLTKNFPRDRRFPFLQAIVFLSAEGVENKLRGNVRQHVYTRDDIRDALIRLDDPNARKVIDRPISKALARAMDAAGIRESDRQKRVGLYELKDLIADDERYQDWSARHTETNAERRIRIFPCKDKSEDEAKLMQRAARREAQVLESIKHDGILQVLEYQQHEQGPALVYEYDPKWVRLDRVLLTQAKGISGDQALNLVRALGNALRYAHDKKLYHRGLSPNCIWMPEGQVSDAPQIKIGNWQSAEREFENSTRHLSVLGNTQLMVSEDVGAYTAPEAWAAGSADLDAQYVDVFSLGALAYLLFTAQAPAETEIELQDKLNDGRGLQVSDVIAGAIPELQALIHDATHPDVHLRTESVSAFLSQLETVEDALTRPENLVSQDPANAGKGDRFDGGYKILARLGQGATAVAFLVEQAGSPEDAPRVLKLANTPEHNERIDAEGEVLSKLRHQYIVEHFGTHNILGHSAILISYAPEGSLAARLRKEGAFQLELLQRLGEDLLQAVMHLEERAIPHRDIKSENVGLFKYGSNLHLLLFDFSLSNVEASEYRAGTAVYLDPYLADKSRRRWDHYAERYATALTLYEMATATLPDWAQAGGLPKLNDEGAIALDSSVFDPAVRAALTEFFQQAFARHTKDRFDNAELMLNAWRQAVQPVSAKQTAPAVSKISLDLAELSTKVGLLAIPESVVATLTRLNVNTVNDFLNKPKNEYSFLTGVGTNTRKSLAQAYTVLRSNLFDESDPGAIPADSTGAGVLSVDQLLRSLAPKPKKNTDPKRTLFINEMLGHEKVDISRDRNIVYWPTLLEVRVAAGLDEKGSSGIYKKVLARWCDNRHTTQLRNDLHTYLLEQGGIITVREFCSALLLRRGSVSESPLRDWRAQAVIRAVLEAELEKQARWTVRRHEKRIIITNNTDDHGEQRADYAQSLGGIADILATEELPPSSTMVEAELHAVLPPYKEFVLPAGRLLPLAVSCSQNAALSSRAECYPRDMPAEKALRLARNALLGVRKLTEDEVLQRVAGRYPEAKTLPKRPKLDTLMRELELGFEWQPGTDGKPGHYSVGSASYGSSTFVGSGISQTVLPPADVDLSIDHFQTIIEQTLQQGRFLALSVRSRHWQHASDQLVERYQLNTLNFDQLLFKHLRAYLDNLAKPPKWSVIIKADAAPAGSTERGRLEMVIRSVLPDVNQAILNSEKPVLLTQPGLLARYGLVDTWLAELRLQMAREHKPLLLLIATEAIRDSAYIDNTPVPAGAGSAEHSRIPTAWLEQVA